MSYLFFHFINVLFINWRKLASIYEWSFLICEILLGVLQFRDYNMRQHAK